MTEYEKGYKDGMAGAALPNIVDNGDKIDGYTYMYKTDSDGIPFINIDSVRSMLNKAADVQPVKRGKWCPPLMGQGKFATYCSMCQYTVMRNAAGIFEKTPFCPHCGADMRGDTNG